MVEGRALLHAFERLRTGNEAVRLVRAVRIRRSFDPEEESRLILSDLISTAEQDLRGSTQVLANVQSPLVREWVEQQLANDRGLVWCSPACIEELAQIMEQLVEEAREEAARSSGPARTAAGVIKPAPQAEDPMAFRE
jgi:hypothetical protein